MTTELPPPDPLNRGILLDILNRATVDRNGVHLADLPSILAKEGVPGWSHSQLRAHLAEVHGLTLKPVKIGRVNRLGLSWSDVMSAVMRE